MKLIREAGREKKALEVKGRKRISEGIYLDFMGDKNGDKTVSSEENDLNIRR